MLIDEPHTRELLSRIVYRLTSDPILREDLMQEALIHLWKTERPVPGQCRSWYLQSCKFHLQNYIAAGRSVDSPKRRRGMVALLNDDAEIAELVSGADGDGALLAQVSARDIMASLSCRLSPFERSVLNHLGDGFRAREIAVKLKVTHPTVIKYRRRIAALAIRLGNPPLPKYQRPPARTHSVCVAR